MLHLGSNEHICMRHQAAYEIAEGGFLAAVTTACSVCTLQTQTNSFMGTLLHRFSKLLLFTVAQTIAARFSVLHYQCTV